MAQLKINVSVSPAAALASGSTQHGDLQVAPTEEQLQALAPERRAKLAPFIAGSSDRSYATLRTSAATWPAVLAGLEELIVEEARKAADHAVSVECEKNDYRRVLASGRYYTGALPLEPAPETNGWAQFSPNYSKNDAEARELYDRLQAMREAERARIIAEHDARLEYAVDADGRLAAPIRLVLNAGCDVKVATPNATSFQDRLAREQVEAKRSADAKILAEKRALVEQHGDAEQLERFDAGMLPAKEFSGLVTRALFAPLASFEEYSPISEQAVAEHCDCNAEDVRFTTSTEENPELDAEQFVRLKAIRAAAPEGATVEVREHAGYDRNHDNSEDPEIRRSGVRVSVKFAGETYSREYALD